MHIEVDVWEIVFLIGAWVAFKWSVRVAIIVLIGKTISGALEKGKEQLKDVTKGFNVGGSNGEHE